MFQLSIFVFSFRAGIASREAAGYGGNVMSPTSMLSFAVLSPVFGSAHSRLSNERDEPLFPRFGEKPLAAARRKAETLMSSRTIQEWLMRRGL